MYAPSTNYPLYNQLWGDLWNDDVVQRTMEQMFSEGKSQADVDEYKSQRRAGVESTMGDMGLGGDWANRERQLKMQGMEGEDAMRGQAFGGGTPYSKGPLQYMPAGTMGRASHFPTDQHFIRTAHLDKTPSAAMMYWNPYNPDRWDDYGAPRGSRRQRRFNDTRWRL